MSARLRELGLFALLRVRRLVRDAALMGGQSSETQRQDLARRYLRGDGIEIGAMHRPLRVPPAARVRYVDVLTREQLIAQHTAALNIPSGWVVETDVIDDGERLERFDDGSVDFVIANHMLEHTEDPIAVLETFARVTRPGGVIFLTLPDARHTFDSSRARTTVEHLLRDHAEGPRVSRWDHYREWAQIECLPEDRVEQRAAEFAQAGARHHFHVWELGGFLAFLLAVDLPLELLVAQAQEDEFTVVLQRA